MPEAAMRLHYLVALGPMSLALLTLLAYAITRYIGWPAAMGDLLAHIRGIAGHGDGEPAWGARRLWPRPTEQRGQPDGLTGAA